MLPYLVLKYISLLYLLGANYIFSWLVLNLCPLRFIPTSERYVFKRKREGESKFCMKGWGFGRVRWGQVTGRKQPPIFFFLFPIYLFLKRCLDRVSPRDVNAHRRWGASWSRGRKWGITVTFPPLRMDNHCSIQTSSTLLFKSEICYNYFSLDCIHESWYATY